MSYKLNDIVMFKVENHDVSIWCPFPGIGHIVEHNGELVIKSKLGPVVTIGKGYDAYPWSIEVVNELYEIGYKE